jgi:pimeloyl-ACP methyl ester carboxylesterase
MTPLFFGNSERRLFGIYDPPAKSNGPARAAVLCCPGGDEQVHAYRTLRQLASRISQGGRHVLRFDYYGTGDSAGPTVANDIAGWCDDIETAIAEIKDLAGAPKVSLVGLRLGANLAAQVAARSPESVDSLVLWEPIPSDGDSGGYGSRSVDTSRWTAHTTSPTLVVLMGSNSRQDELGITTVVTVDGVLPWLEDRVVTGTIPSNSIQRIADWLK